MFAATKICVSSDFASGSVGESKKEDERHMFWYPSPRGETQGWPRYVGQSSRFVWKCCFGAHFGMYTSVVKYRSCIATSFFDSLICLQQQKYVFRLTSPRARWGNQKKKTKGTCFGTQAREAKLKVGRVTWAVAPDLRENVDLALCSGCNSICKNRSCIATLFRGDSLARRNGRLRCIGGQGQCMPLPQSVFRGLTPEPVSDKALETEPTMH